MREPRQTSEGLSGCGAVHTATTPLSSTAVKDLPKPKPSSMPRPKTISIAIERSTSYACQARVAKQRLQPDRLTKAYDRLKLCLSPPSLARIAGAPCASSWHLDDPKTALARRPRHRGSWLCPDTWMLVHLAWLASHTQQPCLAACMGNGKLASATAHTWSVTASQMRAQPHVHTCMAQADVVSAGALHDVHEAASW